jgi:hypothetical protein
MCDLRAVVRDHGASGGAVTVCMNADESPAGLYLLRVGHFRGVSSVGFTDLKEQLLPRLRDGGVDIRVQALPGEGVRALRTRGAFLRCAASGAGAPSAGEWASPTILEGNGAAQDVRVRDSLIMPGAVVDHGAVVVRSIVCPGARVRDGQRVIDAVATRDGLRTDEWALAKARWRRSP